MVRNACDPERRAVSPLERPVWESLTTHQASVSEGNALARRYLRDVNLFASARDDGPQALAALTELVRPGETVFLLQVPDNVIPPGFLVARAAKGLQMVASRRVPSGPAHEEILTLGQADVPEMLALARLTEPGPFLPRTHTLGTFVGVRIGGRLAAMAGERMRFPGYTEVSGVCTHPDFRGRGLARCLSAAVSERIEARGEKPFLHAWKSNQAAISLYEALGFAVRAEVNVAVLERLGGQGAPRSIGP
jgi:predicted GNAT family acetyltransferase